ncbi:MAG: PqqD family protein [Caldilineaceae bacterium]|nr:PqqD family protein [Caldilineaceae bacterium]
MPDSAVLATTEMDGGIVLLHLQTSQYYSLNGTGAQIWQGIQAQQTVGELSRRLVDQYAITHAEATAVVNTLLAELRGETLVQVEPIGVV